MKLASFYTFLSNWLFQLGTAVFNRWWCPAWDYKNKKLGIFVKIITWLSYFWGNQRQGSVISFLSSSNFPENSMNQFPKFLSSFPRVIDNFLILQIIFTNLIAASGSKNSPVKIFHHFFDRKNAKLAFYTSFWRSEIAEPLKKAGDFERECIEEDCSKWLANP